MSLHLHRAMEDLNREILTLGTVVETQINKAILALESRRRELAEEVLSGDDEIDRKEVEIEEACLQILALHQPVAADLRFIIALMKVNNDLERMGDLAGNIAERAIYLAQHDPLAATPDFTEITGKVKTMVRRSLDALVTLDPPLARQIISSDDEVDTYNWQIKEKLMEMMRHDLGCMDRALTTLFASRHLERIADLAVSICEDVIFMVEGAIVRHQHE